MAVNLVQSIQRIAAAVLEADRPMCIRYATVECDGSEVQGRYCRLRLGPRVVLDGFGAAPLLNGSEYLYRRFSGGERVTLLQDRGGQRFWILNAG